MSQESRIIGGTVTEANEFNYTISIQNRGITGYQHSCSGIVYNANWVVTSAQCADEYVVLLVVLTRNFSQFHFLLLASLT